MNKQEIMHNLGLEEPCGIAEILKAIAEMIGFETDGPVSAKQISCELKKQISECLEQLENSADYEKETIEEEIKLYEGMLSFIKNKDKSQDNIEQNEPEIEIKNEKDESVKLDFSVPPAEEAYKAETHADNSSKIPANTKKQDLVKNIKPNNTYSSQHKPARPAMKKISDARRKEVQSLFEKVCGKDENEAKQALYKLSKALEPSEYEKICEEIEKKAKDMGIPKEAWYIAGEIRSSRKEAAKAKENYEKALSMDGTTHFRSCYRLAHLYSFGETDNGKDPNDILKLYLASQKGPEIIPDSYLEAASLCFESKDIDNLVMAKEQLELYLKHTQGLEEEKTRRIEAERRLEEIKLLNKASRPDASPEEIYKAAIFYASLAERKDIPFIFLRKQAEFFDKTLEWLGKAIEKAKGRQKEEYRRCSQLYGEAKTLLEITGRQLSPEEEFRLGNIYFGLGCIEQAIIHMGRSVSAGFGLEADSRLRFFRIYAVGKPENAPAKAAEELAGEYIAMKDYDSAEKILLRPILRENISAKEMLFKIYYSLSPDFAKAEKTGLELAEQERKKNTGFAFRESLIRLYCLNGKHAEAIPLCKEMISAGSVPAMYAYACLCEHNVAGSEPEKAAELFEQAAKHDHPSAIFHVFRMKQAKKEVLADESLKDEMLNYLNDAARGGCLEALYQRGIYELEGYEPLNIKKNGKNYEKAMKDLEEAASKGYAPAAARLMKLAFAKKEHIKAFEILKNYCSLRQNPEDRELIPENLKTSDISEKTQDKDLAMMVEALGSGLGRDSREDPVVSVAELLLSGGEGIDKNIPLAIEILTEFADRGKEKPASLLGEIYYLGIPEKKIEPWEAAFQRKAYFSSEHPVEKNIEKAEKYLLMSDDSWTLYYRACICRNREEWKQAKELFERSGVAPAKYFLGECYQNGQGVGKSLVTAKGHYRDASEAGFAPATLIMADFEKEEEDYEEAMQLYLKALLQGSVEAASRLSQLIIQKKYSAKNILDIFSDGLLSKLKNLLLPDSGSPFANAVFNCNENNANDCALWLCAVSIENSGAKDKDILLKKIKQKIRASYWKEKKISKGLF